MNGREGIQLQRDDCYDGFVDDYAPLDEPRINVDIKIPDIVRYSQTAVRVILKVACGAAIFVGGVVLEAAQPKPPDGHRFEARLDGIVVVRKNEL